MCPLLRCVLLAVRRGKFQMRAVGGFLPLLLLFTATNARTCDYATANYASLTAQFFPGLQMAARFEFDRTEQRAAAVIEDGVFPHPPYFLQTSFRKDGIATNFTV
ncbi:hypothetical protein M3Y99_00476300 [Aphelenchoides fujianensis]|nr:hypothetical protein M3Y99_00476300 [Aphelenchoides fujianensis]